MTQRRFHVKTDQQLKAPDAIDMIVRDVNWLLYVPHEDYYWKDTVSALVELVHTAWLYGNFKDFRGQKMQQQKLLAHVCDILHRDMPSHPSAYLQSCQQRKRGSSHDIISRYLSLAHNDRTVIPLFFLVTTNKKESTIPRQHPHPELPDTIFVPRTLVYCQESLTTLQWRIIVSLCHAAGEGFKRQLHDRHRMGLPFRDGDKGVYKCYVALTIDLGLCSRNDRVDFIIDRVNDIMLKSLALYDGNRKPRKEISHPIKRVYRMGPRGRKFQFILRIDDANAIFSLAFGYINLNAKEFFSFRLRATQRMYMFCEDWKKRLPSLDVSTRFIVPMLMQKHYNHFGMFMRNVMKKVIEELRTSYLNGGDLYIHIYYNRRTVGQGGYPAKLHLIIRHRLHDTPEDQRYFQNQLEQVMAYLKFSPEKCARIRKEVNIQNYNEWLDKI